MASAREYIHDTVPKLFVFNFHMIDVFFVSLTLQKYSSVEVKLKHVRLFETLN